MKCTDESVKLTTFLAKSERRIKEIVIDENIVPDSYRKFKQRLPKIAHREAIKEILVNRQQIGESTKTWLMRISNLIPAFKDLSMALFFINETSLYRESRNQSQNI